ncbi:hypothetical protein PO878_07495 [Iamia majanohamensis]|uniref:Uncharacterized protein n=1 Tax=Iamia majanohamensis TaxID=467976 RepID=A0AAF0BSM8_9ACTN|nr:hypothetical protein [Iamia majanohamensis]WCO68571.1 hypothetical protein PO878_07495 [Iamia majanohamensis]
MPAPDLSAPTLVLETWDDPVVDALGYPARSTYVEQFWLSILGPSTTWLVRHVDAALEARPEGTTLELAATAEALGLGAGRGRHSPLVRALHRACQFGVARASAGPTLAVRRNLPPLTRHQVDRLPAGVRARHDAWRAVERDASTLDAQRRRARRVALALAELREDVPTTEQRLHRWKVHPVVAREAAVWAHRLVRARDPEVDLHPPVGPAAVPSAAPAPPPRTVPTALREEADLGGDAA